MNIYTVRRATQGLANVLFANGIKSYLFVGIKLCENPKVEIIGEDVDRAYISAVKEQSLGTA